MQTLNSKLKTVNSGFSTIELMISMVIFVMTITGIILVVFGNQTVALDNQVNAEALLRANILLEEANAQSRVDFYSLESASSSEDIYEQELMISEVNPCKTNGTASISWSTESGRPLNVTLKSTYINAAEAIALAGDCGSDEAPETDWYYPKTFVSVDLKDLGGPTNGTVATSIDILHRSGNTYAALSTRHSTVSVPDFWMIDVTDIADRVSPYLATLESNLDTSRGLSDVDVAGNFAFASDLKTTQQFDVINITDLSAVSLLASRALPGVDPSGSFPQGRKIFFYNNRVYIGINETAGPEFHVYDVSTPSTPVHLGSIELTHNVHDIIVRGDYAYLATSDNSGEVMVIDITDPGSMVHPDITGMKFNAAGDHDGTALDLVGNKLYLGRKSGDDSPNEPNFYILDVSNPSSITIIGTKFIKRNPTQPLGITAIAVSDRLAFMGTDDSNAEFQIYIIKDPANIINCSEPAFPNNFTDCGKYDFPAKITDIEYDNNLVYSSVESNEAFRVFFDDPSCYSTYPDPCP